MNNEQFRRLVTSSSSKAQDGASPVVKDDPQTTAKPALGSRMRSNIPMTPRNVKGQPGVDFARQVAENNGMDSKRSKSFKSRAPKGAKLATGYRDRTQERVDEDEDSTAKRIKALEESLKLGQIDQATFEKLRDTITGGAVDKTHLVKGLDWKLLERIRRGEDVNTASTGNDDQKVGGDIDDEFESLEQIEINVEKKAEKDKRGTMAPPGTGTGGKRTRDQILAELKASRKRAAAEANVDQPELGSKFRKIGARQAGTRLEMDERGREVLIITDEDGHEKRKVRKVNNATDDAPSSLLAVDETAAPLGADVAIPEAQVEPAEESDDDIYADLGDDYDPLAALGQSSDSDTDDEAGQDEDKRVSDAVITASRSQEGSPPDDQGSGSVEKVSETVSAPRNYFNEDPSTLSVLSKVVNPFNDPAVLSAFAKRSGRLEGNTDDPGNDATTEESRLKKRAAMLSGTDRDMEDMDMGFGGSRFDDADEMAMEGSKVKLSEWKGDRRDDGDDEDEVEGKRGSGKQRKRGPKKRKGDKNNFSDVLRVIESRK